MANESFIKGEVGILSLWDGVSAYIPVACLTNNSIGTTVSTLEANTKCNPGFTERVINQRDYSISLDGIAIDTNIDTGKISNIDLFTIQNTGTARVEWKMITGDSVVTALYGTAIISDLNLDYPNAEFSTFSATFTAATGGIVTVAPNP